MPALDTVYKQYQEEGLVILGVNSTIQDTESAARAFVADLNLSFPILFDHDGTVTRRYRLQSLPTTFFIDRQGIIRAIVPGGPLGEPYLRSKIADLLLQTDAG